MAITSLDDSKAKNVIRQVEFYFSESNLPRDKFLKQVVQESEDGLVSLALICSFTKMRKHLGLGDIKADDVPEDAIAAVADTLKKSNSLKLSEDGKRVGRSTELPEKVVEQVDSRTVAVSPLPYDVTMEDLSVFFGQHGKVNSVRLPRIIGDKKLFCGTALIEFSDEDAAKIFLASSVVYAGAELEMKPKQDFDADRHRKWKEYEKNLSDKEESNAGYPKGLVIAFKLNGIQPDENESTKQKSNETIQPNENESMKQNSNESTRPNENESTKQNGDEAEVPCADNSKESTEDIEMENSERIVNEAGEKASVEENKEKIGGSDKDENVITREEVIEEVLDADNSKKKSTEDVEMANSEKIVNEAGEKASVEENKEKIGGSDRDENVITREDIKATLGKFGIIKYVDFKMGDEAGYVRFDDPDAGIKARAVAALDDRGGFILKNHIMTLEPLSDDLEREYWSHLRDKQQDRRKDFRGNHRGGRGGGRGNRGGRGFNNKRQRRD